MAMTNKEVAEMLGIAESTIVSSTKTDAGTFYRLNGYAIYIPDEIDQNTAAFIYYPGSGGAWPNDASQLSNYINSGKANQIILIADKSRDTRYCNGVYFSNMINRIGEENGVEITNVDCMGFSAGGPDVYSTLVTLASQSEEPGGHAAILNDVVGFTIKQGDIEALVKDESRVMIVEPSGSIPEFAKNLAKGGVDVVVVQASGTHAAHVSINRDILSNGIVNLLSGDAEELNDISYYRFLKFDPSSGLWVNISAEDVYEKFNNAEFVDSPFRYYRKLSKLGNLESNNSYIGETINEIRGLIKNSDFLNNTSFIETYTSTTQIPNSEGDIVQAFFSECANLLYYLEKDTVSIVKIGNGIKELNDTAKEEAENLNSSVTYYSSPSSGSSGGGYVTPVVSTPATPVSTTEPSTTVNVDLKPEDLTEEEYKALFASDGTMEGNARSVWNFLKYKGLSDVAAAGVLGNIQAESNFKLTDLGDNGTSFGLIQWHNTRWDRLNKFCEDNKLDPNSLQGQLEFLWYESLNPEGNYGKNLASRGFYSATDPVEAAVAFHDVVERSASTPEGVRRKRGGYATSWYEKLKGTTPVKETKTESKEESKDESSTSV